MAVGWIYLQYLNEEGIFRGGEARLLDIGCQNLFSIPEDAGMRFVLENGSRRDVSLLQQEIRELAARSIYPVGSGAPVFLSELLDLCSLEYTAYDIFPGTHTIIFDLNKDTPSPQHIGYFDCVLNFGTTEHIFDQRNAFRVIHDVTRAPGHIFHQVPTVGYLNHGFWIYSPKTLLELAAANRYEVIAFWITGPQGTHQLTDLVQSDFLRWDDTLPENNRLAWQAAPAPNGLINALFKKTVDTPFRISLDTTTTAGDVAEELAANYRTS
jgi:hypothetical protein